MNVEPDGTHLVARGVPGIESLRQSAGRQDSSRHSVGARVACIADERRLRMGLLGQGPQRGEQHERKAGARARRGPQTQLPERRRGRRCSRRRCPRTHFQPRLLEQAARATHCLHMICRFQHAVFGARQADNRPVAALLRPEFARPARRRTTGTGFGNGIPDSDRGHRSTPALHRAGPGPAGHPDRDGLPDQWERKRPRTPVESSKFRRWRGPRRERKAVGGSGSAACGPPLSAAAAHRPPGPAAPARPAAPICRACGRPA